MHLQMKDRVRLIDYIRANQEALASGKFTAEQMIAAVKDSIGLTITLDQLRYAANAIPATIKTRRVLNNPGPSQTPLLTRVKSLEDALHVLERNTNSVTMSIDADIALIKAMVRELMEQLGATELLVKWGED